MIMIQRPSGADVRSAKYLATAAHPEIVFRSERVEQSGDGWTLHGDLGVRGQTEPVSVVISSARGTEDGAAFEDMTTIDRYAFGITKGKGMTGRRLVNGIEAFAAWVRAREQAQGVAPMAASCARPPPPRPGRRELER
jgi:polyisoprenoid-binding protein YceI